MSSRHNRFCSTSLVEIMTIREIIIETIKTKKIMSSLKVIL